MQLGLTPSREAQRSSPTARTRASVRPPGRSACRPCAGCPSRARRPERRATRASRARRRAARRPARCSTGSPPGHSARNISSDAVAPDDAAREQHRAARAVALLEDERARRRARAPARPRRGRPCRRRRSSDRLFERERRLVLDVLELHAVRAPRRRPRACSARRRRPRPRCRLASPPRACSSAESTSTPRWLSSGRSGRPARPAWNSTNAPPTSTRGRLVARARSRAQRTLALSPRDLARTSATWSRS